MDLRDRRALKQRAAESLNRSQFPKLVLIHTAVLVAANLLMGLINTALDAGIGTTGGLSGMGMRGVLSTVQLFLSWIFLILAPCWNMGVQAAAIRSVRGRQNHWQELLTGFRRIVKVLLFCLMSVGVFVLLMVVCVQVGSMLTIFLPLPNAAEEMLAGMDLQELMDPYVLMERMMTDSEFGKVMLRSVLPGLIIAMTLYIGAAAYVLYRTRFCQHVLMDEALAGPVDAVKGSLRLTHRNVKNLILLDLSLWWYYLLVGILMVLSYSDLLLPALGVTLPFGPEVAYWISFALNAAGNLLLAWMVLPYVQSIYATAYVAGLEQLENQAAALPEA